MRWHQTGQGVCYRVNVQQLPNSSDATLLMNAAATGDKAAADRLLPLVYEQLRKAAQIQMVGERSDHTFSATALVHEAYLRLAARLRFVAGLKVEETAAALGLSTRTVDRRWAFSRAWLSRHLHETN